MTQLVIRIDLDTDEAARDPRTAAAHNLGLIHSLGTCGPGGTGAVYDSLGYTIGTWRVTGGEEATPPVSAYRPSSQAGLSAAARS